MKLPDEQTASPSSPLRLASSVLSDAGRIHPSNDDYAMAYIPDNLRALQASGCLFIVADGEGAGSHGGEAGRYTTGRVLAGYYDHEDLSPGDRLKLVIRSVGNDLYSRAGGSAPDLGESTLVAAAVLDDHLTIASVGNSRAYLIHDGQAQQITRDHNQVNEILRMDGLSVAEVESAGGQNRLTRSLGGKQDVEADIFADIPLYPGDVLLLCTDGLTRYVDDDQIARLAGSGSPEQACRRLVEWANRSGGEDNVTALVVAFQADEPAAAGPGSLDEPQLDPEFMSIPGAQPAGNFPARGRQPAWSRPAVIGILLVVLLVLVTWWLAELRLQAVIGPPVETGTPEPALVLPAQVTPQPSFTAVETVETPPIAEEPVQPGTAAPEQEALGNTCIWQVEAGQTLFSIVRRFELRYSAGDEYFYYETCDLELGECTGEKAEIDQHASIFAGWHVIIPVGDFTACEQGGGSWVMAGE